MSLVPFATAWNAYSFAGLDESFRATVFDDIVLPILTDLHRVGFDIKVTGDFRHAMDIQRQRDVQTWSLANPGFQAGMDESNSFLLVALADEKPVACIGARLTWIEGGLARALESKRLLYTFPKRDALPGERWEVSSDILRGIRNAYVCWFVSACKLPAADAVAALARAERPEIDNGFLFRGLTRVLNIGTLARWPHGHTLGFADDWVTHNRAIQVEGFKRLEMGVVHHVPPAKRIYHVLHADRDDTRRVFLDPRVTDMSLSLVELQSESGPTEPDDIAQRFAGLSMEAAQ